MGLWYYGCVPVIRSSHGPFCRGFDGYTEYKYGVLCTPVGATEYIFRPGYVLYHMQRVSCMDMPSFVMLDFLVMEKCTSMC